MGGNVLYTDLSREGIVEKMVKNIVSYAGAKRPQSFVKRGG